MQKRIFQSIFLILCIFPIAASAGPIIRSGDSVSVGAEQILEGDFYGFGGTVTISGLANSDVYVAGGSVTVNAPVKQDLVIVGGTINVHAPVEDDLRIVGGEVTIASDVSGDLVVAGGSLKILSTASIGGDVLFFGGDVDISGNVAGSVIGVSNKARIDSSIGGDVSIQATNSFSLGEKAEVLGNVEYESVSELARAQGAVVVGDIQKKIMSQSNDSDVYATLIPLLVLLFAAFTGYLLFKAGIQRLVDTTAESYGTQGLVGLAALFVVPIVSFILMASVLGMLVGLVLFVLYIAATVCAFILSGILLGTLLMRYASKRPTVSLVSITIGVCVFYFLALIPLIGPLLMFAIFAIALGGICMRVYRITRY